MYEPMDMNGYREGMEVCILLSVEQCRGVVEDWMNCNYDCDLNIRRSKKRQGRFIVTTRSPIWAARIKKWHGCIEMACR